MVCTRRELRCILPADHAIMTVMTADVMADMEADITADVFVYITVSLTSNTVPTHRQSARLSSKTVAQVIHHVYSYAHTLMYICTANILIAHLNNVSVLRPSILHLGRVDSL